MYTARFLGSAAAVADVLLPKRSLCLCGRYARALLCPKPRRWKMREQYQNILSIIMTVMLVVGLCPGIALARPNESNGELVLGTSGALVAPEALAISEKSAEALQALTGDGSEIVQAVVKTGHSAAITSDGSLWMWGENYYVPLDVGRKLLWVDRGWDNRELSLAQKGDGGRRPSVHR